MKIIHLELQAGGYSTPEQTPPSWNLGPVKGNKDDQTMPVEK